MGLNSNEKHDAVAELLTRTAHIVQELDQYFAHGEWWDNHQLYVGGTDEVTLDDLKVTTERPAISVTPAKLEALRTARTILLKAFTGDLSLPAGYNVKAACLDALVAAPPKPIFR